MEERRQKEKSKRKRCVNKSRVRDVILLALKTGKVEHSPKVGALLWTECLSPPKFLKISAASHFPPFDGTEEGPLGGN